MLDFAEPGLFDAFVIHPYPSDLRHPSFDDLRTQVLEARALLARRGARERDLVVGETGVPYAGVDRDEIRDYAERAVSFYLTAQDGAIGSPGDAGRLVQRFYWAFLAAPATPIRGFTDNPAFDFAATSLMLPDGRLSQLGEVFAETVRGALG